LSNQNRAAGTYNLIRRDVSLRIDEAIQKVGETNKNMTATPPDDCGNIVL